MPLIDSTVASTSRAIKSGRIKVNYINGEERIKTYAPSHVQYLLETALEEIDYHLLQENNRRVNVEDKLFIRRTVKTALNKLAKYNK